VQPFGTSREALSIGLSTPGPRCACTSLEADEIVRLKSIHVAAFRQLTDPPPRSGSNGAGPAAIGHTKSVRCSANSDHKCGMLDACRNPLLEDFARGSNMRGTRRPG